MLRNKVISRKPSRRDRERADLSLLQMGFYGAGALRCSGVMYAEPRRRALWLAGELNTCRRATERQR